MEKKKTDAERIYEEIEELLEYKPKNLMVQVLAKVEEYGTAKYQEGIEDAIEADVHPDIDEEMRARAEEYYEALREAYG